MTFFSFKKKLNPLIAVICTTALMIFGFVMAKTEDFCIFLILLFTWLCVFGCKKACIRMIPMTAIFGGIFALITYITSDGDFLSAIAMINRFATLFLAVIPGMSVEPVALTRSLSQIKTPRAVTLGMLIVMSFMPVLKTEISRVREAMKTRGAGSVLNPKIFYRAFLIPLVTRLVNISDTLALSVETRGFSLESSEYTVYKKETVCISDVIFVFGIVVFAAVTVIL